MNIDLSSLKKECGNLDDLLISGSDIEFNEMLGEGMLNDTKCVNLQSAYHLGEFGCVYKGLWTQKNVGNWKIADVIAVKTIKSM